MSHVARREVGTAHRVSLGSRQKEIEDKDKKKAAINQKTRPVMQVLCVMLFSFGAAALDTKDPHKGPFRDLIISKHSQDVTGRSGC